ncbi:uncharacterized protein C1orf131 homolog isoform X1 [Narcine bancroftii]|uniref:uncharacterized protein C1orf131 homolog isoform X1 n=1 Tax=Narcine bancroftii TaxID=1343680 RepID=UPI003831B5A1
MDECDGGEDEWRLLDSIFGQLYHYEEPVVGGKNEAKPEVEERTSKLKEKEEKWVCSETQPVPCTITVPTSNDFQKKKTVITSGDTPKCLIRLRTELLSPEDDQIVSTKAEGRKEPNDQITTVSQKKPVEIVSFTADRKKRKLPPATGMLSEVTESAEQDNDKQSEFNLERARMEVHKFGITGYKKEEQRIMEQQRAIALGAKPAKREYVNYKIYQEIMKQKVTAKQIKKNSKLALQKERREERRNKKLDSVLSGQLGRFKNGVLVLGEKDIKKLKINSKSKCV